MSLNREEKAVVIEEVTAELAKAQSIIIAEYRGLDVASATVLRKKARESGVYLRVLKNTLVRRSLTDGMCGDASLGSGPERNLAPGRLRPALNSRESATKIS